MAEGIGGGTNVGVGVGEAELVAQLESVIGKAPSDAAVFMGRIGRGPPAKARSLRLPLERLIVS